jgi:NAD(P)H-hydrate epimerase
MGITIVLKGPHDFVYQGDEIIEVSGGNPGMTKGGTGDVLAGLIAALYTTHDACTAAVVGSYTNKQAGEYLAQSVGPFFNASDLVEAVPKVLWESLKQ